MSDPDVLIQARELRVMLTACQARLSELLNALAALDLPDPEKLRCPDCGLRFPGPRTLAEHRYVSHSGPEPGEWSELERRIAADPEGNPA